MLGNKFLEDIEKKQEELNSPLKLNDDYTPTLQEISIHDFEKNVVENSLLLVGDSREENKEPINNNKFLRSPFKKLSYHTPFLKFNNEKEEESPNLENQKKDISTNNFQAKYQLQLNTQPKFLLNEHNVSSSPQSMRRPSFNGALLDLYELNLLFENMKCYKRYFPHNNSENILKTIYIHQVSSMKKIKRRRYWTKTRIPKIEK